MCIVIFTTAHPDYPLIVIDNRDEFILRPTSRPHWWKHPKSGQHVLSSRDLQRHEQGTWLGITKTGEFAVLTNYRETSNHDAAHPVSGVKSRGGMVTAWLSGLAEEGVPQGVQHLVKDNGVKGVGGFSMVCGKLKRDPHDIAIVSNRCGHVDDVPLVGKERGKTWALSNTAFDDPIEWPKVQNGKKLVDSVVREAAANGTSQQELVASLLSVLDNDTLPKLDAGATMQEYIMQLRNSIFVPPVGDDNHKLEMEEARAKGRVDWNKAPTNLRTVGDSIPGHHTPDPTVGFETGMYGTQRQTVMLVDNDGNVTYTERALWDANGNEIPRGQGDVTVQFKIDGWDEGYAEKI